MMYDYLIVGAGFAGSVLAERIANVLQKKVLLIDKRSHIGGNAYDTFNPNGLQYSLYGPHIFHTNSDEVFSYLSQFTFWRFYEHEAKALSENELYSFPINRLTLNQIYNLNLQSDEETADFLESLRVKLPAILNSEDVIVSQVGKKLFEKFFLHYTTKQWNLTPNQLKPSVCGRIPIRTNTDCRYFTDKYQYQPLNGYTAMFEKMLLSKNIELRLDCAFNEVKDKVSFKNLIYTGPIDEYFNFIHGRMKYRSLSFEYDIVDKEFVQESGIVNYCDSEPSYTRTTEYKYLTGQHHKKSIIAREYPQQEGEPYYPVLELESEVLLKKYNDSASELQNVFFVGRLAEFKYYNMDQIVARSLKVFETEIAKRD